MQAPMLKLAGQVSRICKRDIGIFAPFLQKATDPIQQLFLDKIREYKSKSGGNKLVEPSPDLEKDWNSGRDRIMKQFDMKPDDAVKFPSFNFTDPPLEEPGVDKV